MNWLNTNAVSTDAVMTLLQALVNGNGTMAQFNHSELGGGGQWMRGGMTMVGDMFNYGLKSKVDGLCSELSQLFFPENREINRETKKSRCAVHNGLLQMLVHPRCVQRTRGGTAAVAHCRTIHIKNQVHFLSARQGHSVLRAD
jgi:hypothetical protein